MLMLIKEHSALPGVVILKFCRGRKLLEFCRCHSFPVTKMCFSLWTGDIKKCWAHRHKSKSQLLFYWTRLSLWNPNAFLLSNIINAIIFAVAKSDDVTARYTLRMSRRGFESVGSGVYFYPPRWAAWRTSRSLFWSLFCNLLSRARVLPKNVMIQCVYVRSIYF